MEDQEANAALISQAKNMYYALKEVSNFLDKQILATPSGVSRNQMTDLNIIVKSQILKANPQ